MQQVYDFEKALIYTDIFERTCEILQPEDTFTTETRIRCYELKIWNI